MNVSLSPDETLGRMLHTFSATGYEIDDSNYETLKKYNVVKENDMKILERTKFITWPSENNKDRRIYGYIKNLVWKDPFPSMESYIGLKDLEDKNAIEFPKFYNPQGDFRTPENKFYGILLDGITSKTATLIFEQQDMPEYNEKADEFQKMINSGSLITKWITVDSSNSQELTKIKQIHTIIAERDINSGARAWIVLVKNNGYEKDINEDYITNNGALTPLSPTYTTISLDNNGVLELNDLNTVDSISFGKVVPKTDEHGNPIIENGKEIKKIIYEDDKGNPIENGAVVTMLVTKSEEEVS